MTIFSKQRPENTVKNVTGVTTLYRRFISSRIYSTHRCGFFISCDWKLLPRKWRGACVFFSFACGEQSALIKRWNQHRIQAFWQKNNFLLLIEFKTSLHGTYVALISLFLSFFFSSSEWIVFGLLCMIVFCCWIVFSFSCAKKLEQIWTTRQSFWFALRFIQQFCSCSFWRNALIKWIQNTEEFQFYCKPHFTIHSIENWLQMNKQTNKVKYAWNGTRTHTYLCYTKCIAQHANQHTCIHRIEPTQKVVRWDIYQET